MREELQGNKVVFVAIGDATPSLGTGILDERDWLHLTTDLGSATTGSWLPIAARVFRTGVQR